MIFFVGPLPPPLHGFSKINLAMLHAIQEKNEVKVFDLGSGGKSRLSATLGLLRVLALYFYSLIFLKPETLYMGLSGGLRQSLDIFFLLGARLAGVSIFVHHHSFAYLNKATYLSRTCFFLSKRSTHIVLCSEMSDLLLAQYGISHSNVFVLSNSAFLAESEKQQGLSERPKIVVGFLSNITESKGIFEFFDLIERLNSRGIPILARIAGPVDSSIGVRFSKCLVDFSNVVHVGAVYGADKEEFFSCLDVLVFPTKYVNEAEPVTIFEALSKGVAVIAAARGCISCMYPRTAGLVVRDYDAFVDLAAEEIEKYFSDPAYLAETKESALNYFRLQHSVQRTELDNLLRLIIRG